MTVAAQSKRIAYFDFLRIFATFAIMLQHIDPYKSTDPMTTEYVARLMVDLVTRCGVPLFLMISGALFLSSESSIKRIYTHNILRIVTAFVFWSALYSVLRTEIFGYAKINIPLEFLFGRYHMWFMHLIIELYILTPILRKAVSSWKLGKYLLLVLAVYSSVIPMFKELLMVASPTLGDLSERLVAKYFRNEFHIGIFYFVLGYYLSQCRMTVCRRRWIYAIGLLGVVIAGFGSYALARMGVEDLPLLNNYYVTIIAFSSAVFVFARTHYSFDRMKGWAVSLVLKLSKYTFGAYLVHALILELIQHYIGMEVFRVGPFLAIALLFSVVCLVSFVISAVIHRIPVLRKYIV